MPADEITRDSVKAVWRVEGNSKQVLASLVQESAWEEPALISSIVTQDTERVFEGLQNNTRYVIKLQAIGSKALAPAGGENSNGSETSVIHKTSPPAPENATANPPDSGFAPEDAPTDSANSRSPGLILEDQPSDPAEVDTALESDGNAASPEKIDSYEKREPLEREIAAASESLNVPPVVSDESITDTNLPSPPVDT